MNKDDVKIFDNIVNKWKQTKDKEILYINNKNKVATSKFDIYKLFEGYLNENIKYKDIDGISGSIKRAVELYQRKPKYSDKNKKIINNSNKVINGIELIKSLISYDNFKIPGKTYAKTNNSIDLSWIDNRDGYKQIAEEADSDFMKEHNENELNLIKNFITKINNGIINNKNTAANEFRKLKQKVTEEILKQDLIKYLERYLFGENLEKIEPKDDQKRTFAPGDNTDEADEYIKWMEEQKKDRVRFSDAYDSSGSGLNKKGKGNVVSRAKDEGLKINK